MPKAPPETLAAAPITVMALRRLLRHAVVRCTATFLAPARTPPLLPYRLPPCAPPLPLFHALAPRVLLCSAHPCRPESCRVDGIATPTMTRRPQSAAGGQRQPRHRQRAHRPWPCRRRDADRPGQPRRRCGSPPPPVCSKRGRNFLFSVCGGRLQQYREFIGRPVGGEGGRSYDTHAMRLVPKSEKHVQCY